jgi:prophage maintenance system killer protein
MPMPTSDLRIDLGRVERCLRELQQAFPQINETLSSRRDALGDDVVANLLEGYAYVNTMLEQRVDPFRRGQHGHLLELNAIVLCGSAAAERRRFHRHIEATESHFYETVGGGIREIMEWYDRHRGDDPWEQAAGVYIHGLSEPQLFIEGNHRTGSLIMSFMLVRAGKPPFIVKAESAKGYFDPSTLIRATRKHTLSALWQLPRMKKTFAAFLRDHVDKRALVKAADEADEKLRAKG